MAYQRPVLLDGGHLATPLLPQSFMNEGKPQAVLCCAVMHSVGAVPARTGTGKLSSNTQLDGLALQTQ